MNNLRVAVAAAIAASTSVVLFSTASATTSNPNDASYWQTRTDHPAQCYKHDPPSQQNAHGRLTADGKAVVLDEFNQNWPGDHWELLVVKAGSNGGDGNGNAVYQHPTAGVAYAPPLNNAGQAPAVSHWIVCKGTTPDVEETVVSWVPTDGTCASPDGSLSVEFDGDAVVYVGDPSATYSNGTEVSGTFSVKQGYVITGDGGPFAHTFSSTDGPCDPPVDEVVVPAEPSFVEPTCAAPTPRIDGAADTDAVDYEVTGTVAPGQTVTVTATAKNGYELDPEATATWEHTFSVPVDDACVIDAAPNASIETDCGSAVIIFSNDVGEIPAGHTAASAAFTYRIDGQQETIEVAPNVTIEIPVDFIEDSGTHTVQIGDEPAVEIGSNCELDRVTTVAPMFVDPTCDDVSAGLDVPTVDGISYETEGSTAPGSTVQVTASAMPGYVLVGATSWTHDYPALVELSCEVPAIEVTAFSQVCRKDVPFVEYDIQVTGTDASTATLTFRAVDGDIAAVYEDVPLRGEVVYPGASVDPQDWPGWKLNSVGFWIPDPEDADWRNGLTVEVVVNPTATASVTYPAASAACLSPEIEPPPAPPTSPTTIATIPPTTIGQAAPTAPTTTADTTPPTTVDTIPTDTVGIGSAGPTTPTSELPKTGSDATRDLITIGALLLVAGVALIGATRRRTTALR